MTQRTKTILQIIPCNTELYARYKGTDDGGDFTERVICLALVETTEVQGLKYQSVEGMSFCEAEISSVENSTNFLEYTNKPIVK